MKLNINKYLSEIDNKEKELIKTGGSAWRSGIKEGFEKIKKLNINIIEIENITVAHFKEKMEKELEINSTIEAWKGCSSCLGEEIEWFNGICKVYDSAVQILDNCIIE
jgi:hypothetical protein